MTKASLAHVLSTLPATLRDELLGAFSQIVKNFRERRWEPAELNGGKLCEIVYSVPHSALARRSRKR